MKPPMRGKPGVRMLIGKGADRVYCESVLDGHKLVR